MSRSSQHSSIHTSRRDFLRIAGAGGLGMSLLPRRSAAATERPNIVIILADDMGYSDIGCYGGEINTPALDGLAETGVRFSQFYNTARCCPTRASLLTGLHPHQAGIGHMTFQHDKRGDRPEGPYQGWLNRNCVTIPEVLKSAGYRSYMAGKWHVGTLDVDTWPLARGFDRYYGILNGACNYFAPSPNSHLTLDETLVEPEGDDYYTTDYFTNYALSFLDQHARQNADAPFFLYLAFNSPHWPLQAWPKDIAKYRDRYKRGWDELRKERYARQQASGLLPKRWELSPRDERVPPWEEVDAKKQGELAFLMAIYAAVVDRMDQNIGRVVGKLEEHGWLDNTLMLFLSDNGGCAEGGPLGQYAPEQLGTKEGAGPPKYGACWANASNTPFRRYKHWVHEGGMGTPLIAHWPKRIPARLNGSVIRHYGYLPDLMATCVDVSGATYPQSFNGKPILPLEGKSLAPLLRGEEGPVHPEPICWEHEGNRAVRQGKWKLVALNGQPWELYDLEADRTELHDLSAQQPKQAQELAAYWDAWAQRCGVNKQPPRRPRKLSTKTTFELKPGAHLSKWQAPNVVKRTVTIAATVEAQGKDGVLVAHGGQRVGYSVYLKAGKLTMTLRRNGETNGTTIAAAEPFPTGAAQVLARLTKKGEMSLSVNGRLVAAGTAPGPVNDMPDEDLSVGFDFGGNNGDYKSPNAFGGKLEGVRIELSD